MSDNLQSETLWGQLLSGLESAWSPSRWENVGVVVGCSGGADSVALLRLICELRNRSGEATGFVVAAHYNHGLRGDASDADQAFVAGLAKSLDVRFSAGGPMGSPPDDEAAMRSLRRDFFVRVAQDHGARYVATAHTADDNVETLLHHLMRGTGPPGLAGIAASTTIGPAGDAKDFVLIRPMLAMRRLQIRKALRILGQTWREDASNQNTDYRRNWIRQTLIPLMESEYPQAVTAMNRTVEIQSGWRRLMDELASEWLHQHCLTNQISPCLACDRRTESSIIIAALQQFWDQQGWPRRAMTAEHWRRLADTIRLAQPEQYCIPGNIQVVSTFNEVTFTRSSMIR